jgi:large repetitive protein
MTLGRLVMSLLLLLTTGCFSAGNPVGVLVSCSSDAECGAGESCLAGTCRAADFVPPTAINITVEVVEDTTATFELEPGTPSIVQMPGAGVLRLIDGTGTYEPAPNDVGTYLASYQIARDGLRSEVGTITLVVSATNDAPTATAVNVSTEEDEAVLVVLQVRDEDEGEVFRTRVIDDSEPHIGALLQDARAPLTFIYQPRDDAHGRDHFVVELVDGAGERTNIDVTIDVAPVEDPTNLIVSDLRLLEDVPQQVAVADLLEDADGPVLLASVMSSNPRLLGVTHAGDVLSLAPALDVFGEDFSVELITDDGALFRLPVRITNVEDSFSAVAFFGDVDEDSVDAQVGRLQVNGDVLGVFAFSLVSWPQGWSANSIVVGSDGTVRATPPHNFVGSVGFRWRAAGNAFDVVEGDALLEVLAQPDPIVLEAFSVEGVEDEPVRVPVRITDVDDPLADHIVEVVSLSGGGRDVDGADIEANQDEVVVQPPRDLSGTFVLRLVAYSLDRARQSAEIDVVIDISPVVDAPVVSDLRLTTREDTAVSATIPVSSENNAELSFAVEPLDENAAQAAVTFVGTTITIIPQQDLHGTMQWNLIALVDGLSANSLLTVQVNPQNDAPRVGGSVVDCIEDTRCSFDVDVSDVDGDAVVLSSPDVAMACVAQRCTYTPANNFNGTQFVPVVATDAANQSARETMVIRVAPQPDPLVLHLTAPPFDEDNIGFVVAMVEDVDGVGHSLSVVPGFAAGTLDTTLLAQGVIVIDPRENVNGVFPLVVQATPLSMGNAAASPVEASVDVLVRPVQDPPTISVVSPVGFLGAIDGVFSVQMTAHDPDGDTLVPDFLLDGMELAAVPGSFNGAFEVSFLPPSEGDRRQSYARPGLLVSDGHGGEAAAFVDVGMVLRDNCSLLATTNRRQDPPAVREEDKLTDGTKGCLANDLGVFTPAVGLKRGNDGYRDPRWDGTGERWDASEQVGVGPGYSVPATKWLVVRPDVRLAAVAVPSVRDKLAGILRSEQSVSITFNWPAIDMDCGAGAAFMFNVARFGCNDGRGETGFGLFERAENAVAIYVEADDFLSLGAASCATHEERGAFINGMYLNERGEEVFCTF